MKYYLDGSDWEADYFISLEDYLGWQRDPRKLHNMYLNDATSAGFINDQAGYRATYRTAIPGCDRTVLLDSGELQEPYWGRNLERSRWSEKMSWGFRKRFTLTDEMKRHSRFQLHFCGIDYSAVFFLNGEWIGNHTGAFVPFEVDVTDQLNRDGDNLLAVVFDPMPQALPNHADAFNQKPAEFAEYHRSQCSYGWDWARAMAAIGIWDHVYLNGNDEARISDCFFRANAAGKVELTLDIKARKSAEYGVKISVEPIGFDAESYHFEQSLELEYGDNTRTLMLQCPEPQLWYPRGYGEQRLYMLTLEISGEITRRQVAFRTLKMLRNENSAEGAYNLTFSFNGVNVFARGVNWVPSDLMYCRCDAAGYERLVRLAAEANTNLFRIWGGGIIEKEEFYEACDRYGIIVWQEFMHACSNYRKDAEYLAFKAREGEAVLRKIRNHVCVSMICGGNEVLYYGEIPDSPLWRQYQELAARFTPDLPYHVSSPDLSRPGERHHGPWGFVEHDFINKHDRLLASEVGCNGFTEFESVRKFIPEGELDNPEGQSWLYHFAIPCRSQDWHLQTAPFGTLDSARVCQATMAVQGNVTSYWMNHCRRKFPHTTGCFFWQYNEPWPTFSYSIVDYYTQPKIAYYQLMRAQKCTTLNLRDNSWFCKDGTFAAGLFITSDIPTGEVRSSIRVLTADGQELYTASFTGNYGAGTMKLDEIRVDLPSEVSGGVLLAEMKLERSGEMIFEDTLMYGVPDFKKVFSLPAATVTASALVRQLSAAQGDNDGEYEVEVTLKNGDTAALYLRLNLPDTEVRRVFWRDNYITLAPGETRIVRAAVRGPLRGKVELTAWNMEAQSCKLLD